MRNIDKLTCVSVHAIPVYDGSLIATESDIIENLIEVGEMNVELINDFEIPWVSKKALAYPKYRRTRRKKRVASGEGEEGEDDDEYGSEGDEKEGNSDEEDDDEDS